MRVPKRIELVEGTLLGLAAVSGAILIFEPFFPTTIHAARERLMPALVCGLLIHIWNMSVEMRRAAERHAQSVDDVREAVQQASERHAQSLKNLDDAVRATTVRTFANQSEFQVYIRSRFSTASRVQVTHFASRSLSAHDAEYRNIVDEFITRGGKYYRVVCDSLDPNMWRDQLEWMAKYAGKQFFLHYLAHVAVDNMKLLDVMIIDDDEVCFGGGYQSGFDFPVMSIRNADTVRFYKDYYRHLSDRAPRVTHDSDILQKHLARKVLTWRRSAVAGNDVTKTDV